MGDVVQIVETKPDTSDFAEFWRAYPRHVAKQSALKAWGKLKAEDQRKAIEQLPLHRLAWNGKEVEFIPHPATWLNGRRFEDELQVGAVIVEPTCAKCGGSLAAGFVKRREGPTCNKCERAR